MTAYEYYSRLVNDAIRAGRIADGQCPVCLAWDALVQDPEGVVYCELNSDHYRSDVTDRAT